MLESKNTIKGKVLETWWNTSRPLWTSGGRLAVLAEPVWRHGWRAGPKNSGRTSELEAGEGAAGLVTFERAAGLEASDRTSGLAAGNRAVGLEASDRESGELVWSGKQEADETPPHKTGALHCTAPQDRCSSSCSTVTSDCCILGVGVGCAILLPDFPSGCTHVSWDLVDLLSGSSHLSSPQAAHLRFSAPTLSSPQAAYLRFQTPPLSSPPFCCSPLRRACLSVVHLGHFELPKVTFRLL